MIFCPECGEENPEGSKFCKKCGVNLVYEEPEPEPKTTAKKVTLEDEHGPVNPRPVNTSNTGNKKEDGDKWCWCCICIVFLFIVFAILGH